MTLKYQRFRQKLVTKCEPFWTTSKTRMSPLHIAEASPAFFLCSQKSLRTNRLGSESGPLDVVSNFGYHKFLQLWPQVISQWINPMYGLMVTPWFNRIIKITGISGLNCRKVSDFIYIYLSEESSWFTTCLPINIWLWVKTSKPWCPDGTRRNSWLLDGYSPSHMVIKQKWLLWQ